MDDCLRWRYLRDSDVLYLTAEYVAAQNEYVLVIDQLDSTQRVMRFAAIGLLYEYLGTLERQLGATGWELLPVDQRAPNRLRTPICELCLVSHPVEVTHRSKTHVVFQCSGCGYRWVVPKPGTWEFTRARSCSSDHPTGYVHASFSAQAPLPRPR
jgi:hypothetical protein